MASAAPVTLYFHGLPGSAAELRAFGPQIAEVTEDFHVVARNLERPSASRRDYFDRLAESIERTVATGEVRLVGFSLGAAAALQVAPRLGARVSQIDLVSPAGPLGLGDFIAHMAGAPVFRAAQAGRLAFAAFTAMQAQFARFASRRLATALMAKARGADRALTTDPQFLAQLAFSLRSSLLGQRAAYVEEIRLYVADWSAELAKVRQPVTIWQGSEDDWTPPMMARALAEALPDQPEVNMLSGLSHFSTLRFYLESMVAQPLREQP